MGHCFTWQDTHPFRVLVLLLVCWNIDGVMNQSKIMEQNWKKMCVPLKDWIKGWVGNKWKWYFFSGWCGPGIVCTRMVLYISSGWIIRFHSRKLIKNRVFWMTMANTLRQPHIWDILPYFLQRESNSLPGKIPYLEGADHNVYMQWVTWWLSCAKPKRSKKATEVLLIPSLANTPSHHCD